MTGFSSSLVNDDDDPQLHEPQLRPFLLSFLVSTRGERKPSRH